PRVISDVTPDNNWRPGARYAQNREPPERGFRPLIIRGRVVEPEPGQASRLFEAETRAEFAIAHVRKLDPHWRPRPSAYESVEGLAGGRRGLPALMNRMPTRRKRAGATWRDRSRK